MFFYYHYYYCSSVVPVVLGCDGGGIMKSRFTKISFLFFLFVIFRLEFKFCDDEMAPVPGTEQYIHINKEVLFWVQKAATLSLAVYYLRRIPS